MAENQTPSLRITKTQNGWTVEEYGQQNVTKKAWMPLGSYPTLDQAVSVIRQQEARKLR